MYWAQFNVIVMIDNGFVHIVFATLKPYNRTNEMRTRLVCRKQATHFTTDDQSVCRPNVAVRQCLCVRFTCSFSHHIRFAT